MVRWPLTSSTWGSPSHTPFSCVPLGSSESQSPPNIFPLISCEDPLSDATLVAMGCLAKDFLPSPVTFSWSYQNSSAINSQAFYDFPSVFREGKYAASSQLLLPSADLLESTEEFVTCNVKHFNSDKNVKVPLPGEMGPPPLSRRGGCGGSGP